MKTLLATVAAVAALATAPLASARSPTYCSPSGDVCVGINLGPGGVSFQITTVAKYFSKYQLCVTGPKRRVCHVYAIRKSGSEYGSTVRFRHAFPNQGPGIYKVHWNVAARTLMFRIA